MPEQRFVFAVQGEGRGHLTQAIALFRLLQEQGHTVSCVIVGRNPNRELPDFFLRKITVPIIQVESPHFCIDSSGRSVSMGMTILKNLANRHSFSRSLRIMRDTFDTYNPHVVINFYEPLVALYVLRYNRNFRIISLAHQYIYLHEGFRFPKGSPVKGRLLKWYTAFTSIGSERIMALSMYDLPASHRKQLLVCPPLLRHELFQKSISDEGFILVYLVNSGFMRDIMKWHARNPGIRLVVFTDNRDVKERHKGLYRIDDTLSFHSLNDEKFMDMMSRCSSLVCTAGFESVCEAMYLSKPVMLVPVPGHFEQYCNARDAQHIGAGIHARQFDLDILNKRLMLPYSSALYKEWVCSFSVFLKRTLDTLETKHEQTSALPYLPPFSFPQPKDNA